MSAMNTLKKLDLNRHPTMFTKIRIRILSRSWTGQINFPVVDFLHREAMIREAISNPEHPLLSVYS